MKEKKKLPIVTNIIIVMLCIAGLLPAKMGFAQQTTQLLTGFHSLEVSGLAKVYIEQGNEEKATLKIAGIPASDVIVVVKDSILKITTKGTHNGETVNVYVSYRHLKKIQVGNAAELHAGNTLKATHLDVTVSGSAAATLDVDVTTLDITTKDAADLKISGKTDTQTIHSTAPKGSLDNSALHVIKS